MSLRANLCLVACLGLALLTAAPATAQKPPKEPATLIGRWQTRQIGFALQGTPPDSVLARLEESPAADLNDAIFAGDALLVVEFKADSTYDFVIMNEGETIRRETGRFSVRQGRLLANSPGSADGSSFDDQQIKKLARRALTLTFPLGPEMPGIVQEVEYRRLGPYPATSGN